MSNLGIILWLVLIGLGATAVMDIWVSIRQRVLGVPALDYAMVGRWAGHMLRGVWWHTPINKSSAIKGEWLIGWAVHLGTGIGFALLFGLITGPDWLSKPTLGPPLFFGLATVIFPFFVMQPALGAGVAAANSLNPRKARLHSFITHAIFGFGLYLSAWVINAMV